MNPLFWVWLTGYIVTFVTLFIMSVVIMKRAIKNGENLQPVKQDFNKYIWSSAVFSLLSWFGLAFCITVIIILKKGVK